MFLKSRILARQHEIILRVRRSSERPNISALAQEFNVPRKTIHRDLHDTLREAVTGLRPGLAAHAAERDSRARPGHSRRWGLGCESHRAGEHTGGRLYGLAPFLSLLIQPHPVIGSPSKASQASRC